MPARLFLWIGHPARNSLSHTLMDAYERGAISMGAEIRRLYLADMMFDPNLANAYREIQPLEPALREWQDNLTWCQHTCWAYPMWWGTMPAKMKGALDRALLPGFGFAYHDKDPFWDRLLKGRSGHAIITADTPSFYDRLTSQSPVRKQVKTKVMGFVGIKPVKTLYFAQAKTADDTVIEKWKRRAYNAGADAGRR